MTDNEPLQQANNTRFPPTPLALTSIIWNCVNHHHNTLSPLTTLLSRYVECIKQLWEIIYWCDGFHRSNTQSRNPIREFSSKFHIPQFLDWQPGLFHTFCFESIIYLNMPPKIEIR
ncbi:hypothetical protein BLNAU_15837 [Blattamonas nauphoetae]|uniref:Uncharacterized protein n=1 Tax=Blattamonas nauphoetae TaxID=2049346 RepID=A0ABQ9XC32_9EUKA|nr:hypothetical protein BLNAU_15837 [Blattamonas nauphoetae]